ncbi:MAG: hypothetical protein K2X47_07660, partial [Bdellovibrionales bacterium]|nr:hypothetical protein [Bdellovibrionales bacterium]
MPFRSLSLVSLVLVLAASHSASADGVRPSDFVDAKGNKAVFVDFKDAHYNIRFDVAAKTAKFVSVISFETSAEGA